MNDKRHLHVIEQVPVDYYQKGIKRNILQRFWHKNKLAVVLSLIRFKPKSILDVGCASGWFLSSLVERFPKARCCGIDIYSDGIKHAKKLYPRINLKVADAHKIPYASNTFDLVVCTEVLEHVTDPKSVLQEIKRVLKNKRNAIIELDSGSLLFSIVWFLWRKVNGKVWNDSHVYPFNLRKLSKMITDCGFEIINKKKFNLGMAMVFLIRKNNE